MSTRKRRPRRTARGSAKIGAPGLLQELSAELLQLNGAFLGEFLQLSPKARRALRPAVRSSKRSKLSTARAVLDRFSALSDMLTFWYRDKRYLANDGTPRVLPIYGKGITFETLARKFLPNTPLKEVIRLICTHADVQQQKDNKLACVGSSALIYERTREVALASFITRVRALASNYLHNIEIPSVKGEGYFDRHVRGVLSEKAFNKYATDIRPQLQDLCESVDSGLQVPAAPADGKKRKECGLVMFLFRDDGRLD